MKLDRPDVVALFWVVFALIWTRHVF